MEYLLKNGQGFVENQVRKVDILVRDGRIAAMGGDIVPSGDAVLLDMGGTVIFPGFVDVHVHLREPGFSYKETIATGTRAAARGGFTQICPMPNLSPVPDSRETLAEQLALIQKDAVVRVTPYGAITCGEKGEALADLAAMAPDVAGFSDDGRGVQSEAMMREAMEKAKGLGKIIAAHCEDNSLLHGGYIHDGAYAKAHGHRGICSESEWGPIRRDLRLAEETGCAYHVCHISTKESVALIREAKARGVDVTCETGPHYLVFSDEDLQEDGRFKMNPPLRSPEDKAALIEGIVDGTIDMIATDHAPHSREEKAGGLRGSLMGVVGLETAFPILYQGLVKAGRLPLERLLYLMCDAPRLRFRLPGGIEEGQCADLAVWDLDAEWVVEPEAFHSLGRATPFAGQRAAGRCVETVVGGISVWKG